MPKYPSRKGINRYSAFHGHAPRRVARVNLSHVRELIYLARPEFITYISDKSSGGGEGFFEGFKHRFSASTRLYTNPEGNLLIIMGPNLRVTERGIVG